MFEGCFAHSYVVWFSWVHPVFLVGEISHKQTQTLHYAPMVLEYINCAETNSCFQISVTAELTIQNSQ